MGWEAIAPASVVLMLLGVVWNLTNKRIDEKAEKEFLTAHITESEKDAARSAAELQRIQERMDRELSSLNTRHEDQVKQLREEINRMSERLDKRFDQIIGMLNSK